MGPELQPPALRSAPPRCPKPSPGRLVYADTTPVIPDDMGIPSPAVLGRLGQGYAELKGVPARLASLILFLIESEGVQIPGEIRIPTRYSHEHLGTMIGANREAVTRAFGRLQDEGALQIRRRLIYVDDVEALERVAGRLLEEEGDGLS
jgi:hypothetical protein